MDYMIYKIRRHVICCKFFKTFFKTFLWVAWTGCVIMLLYVTLANRDATPNMRYKIDLFWSYREVILNQNIFILWQIIWNVLAFVPMGNLCYYLLDQKRKWYKVFLACGMFSGGIELTQLFCRTGLFEFDDILHNTLGAMLGYWIASILAFVFVTVDGWCCKIGKT